MLHGGQLSILTHCFAPMRNVSRVPVQERHGQDEVDGDASISSQVRISIDLQKDGYTNRLKRIFGGGKNAHGLVRKAQEEVRVDEQVARREVRVLGCDPVDLERDGEVVVLPQGLHVLHGVGNQLAEEDRPRVWDLRSCQCRSSFRHLSVLHIFDCQISSSPME